MKILKILLRLLPIFVVMIFMGTLCWVIYTMPYEAPAPDPNIAWCKNYGGIAMTEPTFAGGLKLTNCIFPPK